jgi:hypothetical protein
VEPYDTIAAAALVVLIVLYALGLPATVIVAVVQWRSRTRPQPLVPVGPPRAAHRVSGAPRAAHRVPGAPRAAHRVPGAPPPTVPALAPPPVGPAFLRLQGLERRVLALRDAPVPVAAYRQLAAEAAELLGRHGSGSTIGRYAAGLLAVVEALAPPDLPLSTDPPPPPETAPAGLPDLLRVELGRLAAAGRPIPAGWAFAWLGHLPDRWPVLADPYLSPGTAPRPPSAPHDRLARAFDRRYAEAYPHGGMIVALTGARLALRYTPASARFGGQPLTFATGLPDVAMLPDPVRRLRAIGTAAAADL